MNSIEIVVFHKLKFLILPRHNLLLGCDWNKTIDASIESYNNTLTFGRREIKLDPQEEYSQQVLAFEFDVFAEELLDSFTNKVCANRI